MGIERWLYTLPLRLRSLFRRKEVEDDLDDEIRDHIERQTAANMRDGMSAADARAAARREFGNVSVTAENARDIWPWRGFGEFARDVRMAVRSLRRTPAFTGAAGLTLALGIGATTVIFSVADHVVLRSLSYPDADRLLAVHEVIEEMRARFPEVPANASHFLRWRRDCTTCDGVAAFRRVTLTRSDASVPERVSVVRASANLLPLLGARTQVGRLFSDTDDQVGHEHVLIISDDYWHAALGADPAVLSRTLTLNGIPMAVVGVLAPGFHFPQSRLFGGTSAVDGSNLFVPLALTQREQTTPGEFDYHVIVRGALGAPLAQVQAQLATIESRISVDAHAKFGMTLRTAIAPLRDDVVGPAGRALLLLMAAVAGVLLIACVNLANLFLARYAARHREAAVRVALGARAGRLVAQTMTECLLLTALGGATGILLSRWGLAALLAFAPADLPRLAEIHVDGRVLAVAIAASLATGLAFGITPALRFARVDPGDALKAGGRAGTPGRNASRIRRALIASQVALSALLLVATGLLLTSFVRVLRVDKGFQVEPVLALDIELPPAGYPDVAHRAAFYDDVLRRLGAVPGATASAMTSFLPLGGENQVDFLALEHDQRPDAERPSANIRYVSPGYFTTLGIPIRDGRDFNDADRAHHAVILSQRAARLLWPNEPALGKRMVPGSNDSLAEVVGVVSDVRTSDIEKEGSPVAYIPYSQDAPPVATLLIRSAADPSALTATARDVIHSVGPSVPVGRVRTLAQVVSGAVAQRRFQLVILLCFAVTALATAGVGIYGIMAHSLVQRANEIGIRMALGAGTGDIYRLALVEGLVPAGAGLGAGILASMGLSRALRSLLFEVQPGDPMTIASVAVVLTLLAALASLVPALRAARADPMEALRVE